MADRTILELAYKRETLLQQGAYPQPGVPPHMQPGAGPFRASNNRETYRKELIAELTSKILEQTPRNDREAVIQLECIVDQWKPRLATASSVRQQGRKRCTGWLSS
jgi:hypothetical protein